MERQLSKLSRRDFLIASGIGMGLPFALEALGFIEEARANEAALYEAAKKEGRLVYYTVFFNQDVVNQIGTAFTAKYPGIRYEGTRKVAAALFQQLNQELRAGVRNCDVFGTTDIGQMIDLRDQKRLLQYTPTTEAGVDPKYRNLDPKNFYQVGAIIPLVIGYNTKLLKPQEAPQSWKALLNDRYKNKITTGSGLASGQVGTWAWVLQQRYGWDNYFRRFNALGPKLGRSINDAMSDLISGERSVGIVPLGQLLTARTKGNPVEVVYPSDGTVVVIGPVGILNTTTRPNAAKLFMNFLMSKEYSELAARVFEQPIRTDVKVRGSRTVSQMNPVIPTPNQLDAGLPDIRRRWRTLFGS
jgi:iron(III) transport system substrate-binding protein